MPAAVSATRKCAELYRWQGRRQTRKAAEGTSKDKKLAKAIEALDPMIRPTFMKGCTKRKLFRRYKDEADYNKKQDIDDKKLDKIFKKFDKKFKEIDTIVRFGRSRRK